MEQVPLDSKAKAASHAIDAAAKVGCFIPGGEVGIKAVGFVAKKGTEMAATHIGFEDSKKVAK